MKSMNFSGILKTDMISKKMNEAIAQMSFSTEGAKQVDTDNLDKKIDTVLTLVQSIRLQSPANHTGLVIAFSAINSEIPFPTNAGISFSWFRIKEGEKLGKIPLDQTLTSFYLPTIDDVGFNICAQFEDEFEQGLSRHIESDVIVADPMIRASGENLLRDRFHKVSENSVTFGSEKITKSTSNSLKQSTSTGCLSMDGMSSIEVDSGGIFLLLPVSTEVISTGGSTCAAAMEEDRPIKLSSLLKNGVSRMSFTSGISQKNNRKHNLNESRMTLHIPACESITVRCTQAASLIISIPLQRAAVPHSFSDRARESAVTSHTTYSSENNTETEGDSSVSSPHTPSSSHGTDAQTASGAHTTPCETSGPPIAPWSYIQSHNERAVDVTEDDEVEASDFARTMTSLERYIAALPCTATEVEISISCTHRLQRDTLALAIRALAAQSATATTERRRSAFPWSDTVLPAPKALSAASLPTPSTQTATADCGAASEGLCTAVRAADDCRFVEVLAEVKSLTTAYVVLQKELKDVKAAHTETETQHASAKQQLEDQNKALLLGNKKLEEKCSAKTKELQILSEKSATKEPLLAEKEREHCKMTLAVESLEAELSDAKEALLALTNIECAAAVRCEHLEAEWRKKEQDLLSQIEALRTENETTCKELTATSAESEKYSTALQAAEKAEGKVEELQNIVEDLHGDIRRLKRCTDSQSRDLKRAIREKENLEKALQTAVAATAAAEASAAAAAITAAASQTRRNSDCPPFQKPNENGAGWESMLHVPTFKSVKSSSSMSSASSTIASVTQRSAAIMPDISAYLKGNCSSSHAAPSPGDTYPKKTLEQSAATSGSRNPFDEETHLKVDSKIRQPGDGNYSDCDNESEDETESDNEIESNSSSPHKHSKNPSGQGLSGAQTLPTEDLSPKSMTKKLMRTFLG